MSAFRKKIYYFLLILTLMPFPARGYLPQGSVENRSNVIINLKLEYLHGQSYEYRSVDQNSVFPLPAQTTGVEILRNHLSDKIKKQDLKVIVTQPDGHSETFSQYGGRLHW